MQENLSQSTVSRKILIQNTLNCVHSFMVTSLFTWWIRKKISHLQIYVVFFFYWHYNPLGFSNPRKRSLVIFCLHLLTRRNIYYGSYNFIHTWSIAIFFHSTLSLHTFLHPLIPIICISSSISSIHLFVEIHVFSWIWVDKVHLCACCNM
jgi:hypothetical protein